MLFTSPGQLAFSIGSVDIYWYGIVMSLSMLIGIFTIIFIRNKYFKDISIDIICDLSFILIIFGIFAARVYYVVMDYSYFIKYPLEIPAIWNGGISIQGAIIGGILGGYIYAKENKLSFFKYADLFSFGVVMGQVIGRWGNFFNSEAFGLPCDLPFKLYIPYLSRPLEYREYEFFHPAFLYESLLNLLIFGILYFILVKLKSKKESIGCIQYKEGVIFFSYIILYSVVRIIIESLRIDSVLNICGLHIAHIMSFIFIVCAIIGLSVIYKEKNT